MSAKILMCQFLKKTKSPLMDNTYIKWKLKSFYIQICHEKVLFCMRLLKKLDFHFFSLIFIGKKLERKLFKKTILQAQKFYFLMIFNTKNRKNTWRFETPSFIPHKIASHQRRDVLILPHPPFLGLISPIYVNEVNLSGQNPTLQCC